jgi:signal transduction histidine kinase
VANAAKHAQATRVSVRLQRAGAREHVEIDDDGCGFDAAQAQAGLGLASMRERAARLPDGALTIDSSAHGTRVRLTFAAWEPRG